MKRCAICEKPDCRCGMEMWEEDDAADAPAVVAATESRQYPHPPRSMQPMTQCDRVALFCVGMLVGTFCGVMLGAIVASGK